MNPLFKSGHHSLDTLEGEPEIFVLLGHRFYVTTWQNHLEKKP